MTEENAENIEQMLSDAANQLSEAEQKVAEVKEETQEEPEVTEQESTAPEIKEDEEEIIPHGERSRLGRKFKRLEDDMTQIKSVLDILKERVATPQKQQEDEIPELPEAPTADEIKEYWDKRETLLLRKVEAKSTQQTEKASKAQKEYSTEYTRLMKDTLDLDFDDDGKLIVPEDVKDVFALLSDEKDLTYNQVYKGDPKEDFLINFKNATRAVFSKSKPQKPPTTQGKKPGAVNVPNVSASAPKVIDRNKLGKDERDLIDNLGFSENDLAEMGF